LTVWGFGPFCGLVGLSLAFAPVFISLYYLTTLNNLNRNPVYIVPFVIMMIPMYVFPIPWAISSWWGCVSPPFT
jgi:hypothetical protein